MGSWGPLSMVTDVYDTLRKMRKREFVHQLLNLASIGFSALMIWKSLMVMTSTESPVVVVLSGSMEPGFVRGDLLFLYLNNEPFRAGDIVVFKIDGRDIPIVHRVLVVHETPDGKQKLLTKGDANNVHDRGLYAMGQQWLEPRNVIGRAHGYLPNVGMVTIIMTDYPQVKYLMLGILAIIVLTTKEN